mgnify:CR=1 FL=1
MADENAKIKVLIVDDDERVARALRRVLQSSHDVEIATSGRAAIDRLKKENYDLVLSDIWMPRMNGFELLAWLRNRPGGSRVIVLTSDDTPETLLTAIREQAYHYIRKPVDPKELLRLVALERQAPRLDPGEPRVAGLAPDVGVDGDPALQRELRIAAAGQIPVAEDPDPDPRREEQQEADQQRAHQPRPYGGGDGVEDFSVRKCHCNAPGKGL